MESIKHPFLILFYLLFSFSLSCFSDIFELDDQYQNINEKNYVKIINILSNAIKKVPDNIPLRLERGETNLFFGNYKDAISDVVGDFFNSI